MQEIDRLQQHVLEVVADLEDEQKKSLRLERDLESTADIQNRVKIVNVSYTLRQKSFIPSKFRCFE